MRFYLRIQGHVQGIGYRYFVRESAKQLHLTGWVRNCSNGDVEMEAQGTETEIQQFITNIEKGHPWAQIEHIAREQCPDRPLRKEFEIRF